MGLFGESGETVTYVNRVATGYDIMKEPVYGETLVEYSSCIVAAVHRGPFTEENAPEFNKVVTDLELHFTEAYPDVSSEDAFIVRGKRFEAVGGGFLWVDPFTSETFGYSVKLKRVAG